MSTNLGGVRPTLGDFGEQAWSTSTNFSVFDQMWAVQAWATLTEFGRLSIAIWTSAPRCCEIRIRCSPTLVRGPSGGGVFVLPARADVWSFGTSQLSGSAAPMQGPETVWRLTPATNSLEGATTAANSRGCPGFESKHRLDFALGADLERVAEKRSSLGHMRMLRFNIGLDRQGEPSARSHASRGALPGRRISCPSMQRTPCVHAAREPITRAPLANHAPQTASKRDARARCPSSSLGGRCHQRRTFLRSPHACHTQDRTHR